EDGSGRCSRSGTHLVAAPVEVTIELARERAHASEPRDRSERAKRRARARVGESEGRSPSEDEDGSGRCGRSGTGLVGTVVEAMMSQRGRGGANEQREWATRTERAGEAGRERACRGVRGAKPLG